MRGLRHRLVAFLRRRRFLFPGLLFLRAGRRPLLVRRSTDVLVDGYLRSANTYAYHAFRRANPSARIAHHLHSTVQFSRAARYGVPAILVVRRPDAAVASAVVQAPSLSPRTALREWIAFHRAVWPVRDHYVIGLFDEVTSNFAAVIRRLNRMFGSDFALYERSETSDAGVFDEMERDFRALYRPKSDAEVETFLGRPSEQRASRLDEARTDIERSDTDAGDLATALAVYDNFERFARTQADRLGG